MLALATSLVVALFIVIPELLYRLILAKFLSLRSIVRTHAEELGRALFTILLPLGVAFLIVRFCPVLKDFPWVSPLEHLCRAYDYRVLASVVIDSDLFRKNPDAFYESLYRTGWRQGRFLSWFYILTIIEALILGSAAKFYGRWKHATGRTRLSRLDTWFVEQFLIPKISEWQLLLTPFTLPDPKSRIKVDVLMTDDVLYQGWAYQHFLDNDGRLSGLILSEPKRYDRNRLLKDREAGKEKPTIEYWRDIPSARLYLFADKIVNLNVNYHSARTSPDIILKYLERQLEKPLPNVTVTIKLPPMQDDERPQARG